MSKEPLYPPPPAPVGLQTLRTSTGCSIWKPTESCKDLSHWNKEKADERPRRAAHVRRTRAYRSMSDTCNVHSTAAYPLLLIEPPRSISFYFRYLSLNCKALPGAAAGCSVTEPTRPIIF
ncbi:hypothetical protein GDO81_010166 [Engystomops pustulosus]|uniref:Uncharacterized protein n=1 Tax=Engystomops pustulosus TaxID=76066 RepID=A0AAV7BXF0_ENGPU|nr:hypothetical protein GDO81_010166 [Engystomops pustulosus]